MSKHATEQEMREAKVPTPESQHELMIYIDALMSRPHDYGTCVYAMSMAATAAFNYVASGLGVTGFQASCADMDILRRTRSLKAPLMLIKGEDYLFPQTDPLPKVLEFRKEISEWLATEAKNNLETKREHAHPNVVAHWQMLAGA